MPPRLLSPQFPLSGSNRRRHGGTKRRSVTLEIVRPIQGHTKTSRAGKSTSVTIATPSGELWLSPHSGSDSRSATSPVVWASRSCERVSMSHGRSRACYDLSVSAASSQPLGMGGTLLHYSSARWLAVARCRPRRCVFCGCREIESDRLENIREGFLFHVGKQWQNIYPAVLNKKTRKYHSIFCCRPLIQWSDLRFQPTWTCSPECCGLRSSAPSQNTPLSDGLGRPAAHTLPCT